MFAGKAFVGGKDYVSKHLKSNDYYEKNHEVEGFWYGAGCSACGVLERAAVREKDFEALRDNKHAVTGEKLTKRHNTVRRELERRADGKLIVKTVCNRRNFYDFTLSAPKSFSVLGVTGGDSRVYQWHNAALHKVLGEMERYVAKRVRGRGAGKDDVEFTRKFAAALYQHNANRALEPQLHTHIVVFNVTEHEGRKYAIEFNELMKRSRYFTALYRDELARRALEGGVDIHIDKHGAPQVKGLDDIADHFSKRTKIIEELIAKCEEMSGIELSRVQKKELTFGSRGIDLELFNERWKSAREGGLWRGAECVKKFAALVRSCSDGGLTEVTTESVIKSQVESLSREQYGRLCATREKSLQSAACGGLGVIDGEGNKLDAGRAVEYAVSKVFERSVVGTKYDLMTAAVNHSMGAGVGEKIRQCVDEKIASGALLAHGEDIAPVELVDMEKSLINVVVKGQGRSYSVDGFRKDQKLSSEQARVVEGVVSCGDQFVALVGDAGTGKTFSTSEVVRAFIERGRRVFMCAPSNGARDVLRADGKSISGRASERVDEESQWKAVGRPFERALSLQKFMVSRDVWRGLPSGSLIILDEAGLASLKQLHDFVKLAEKRDWKILFVGDPKQHTAVEAGDAFRLLLQHSNIRQFRLKDIRRQKENALGGKYREAAKCLAAGNVMEGLSKLDAAGAVVEVKGDARYEKMAQSYIEKMEQGMSCIVVNATHRENDLAAESIRKKLKERNMLGVMKEFDVYRSLGWNTADKELYHKYTPGMIIAAVAGKEAGRVYTVEKYVKSKGLFAYDDEDILHIFKQRDLKGMDVAERRRIEVAVGDLLMVRTNIKGADGEFINGETIRVASFTDDGRIVDDKKRILNTRAFTYGYASTSHKSQGVTKDAVIIGFDRHSVNIADTKLAYVAGTRGTTDIQIFCESKESLATVASKSGDRSLAIEKGIYSTTKETLKPKEFGFFFKKSLDSLYDTVQEKAFSIGAYIEDVFRKIHSGVKSLTNINAYSVDLANEQSAREFFNMIENRKNEYNIELQKKKGISNGKQLEAGRK